MKKTVLAFACVVMALTSTSPSIQAQVPGLLAHHRWMGELFAQAPVSMDQSLARFIFPGSHDAGTYRLSPLLACDGCVDVPELAAVIEVCNTPDLLPSGFENICADTIVPNLFNFTRAWGQAQHLTIRQQLDAGARYFDLRFFKATDNDASRSAGLLQTGRYYIHHTLAGAESAEILDDVVEFLAEPGHEQEVLLLEFGGLKEGGGRMGSDSRREFLAEVRARLGPYMAPKVDPACAGDLTCAATARLGHATTIRELLAQGSQVIVTCNSGTGDGVCDADADDVWNSFTGLSPYSVSTLDPPGGGGYPTPDDTRYPWVSDQQMITMLDKLSEDRDARSKAQIATMGVQVGIDDSAKALIRSAVCRIDAEDVSGWCPAPNNDWDEFLALSEVAAYTNQMALPALSKMRRDRVNVVAGDHYSSAWTDEIFKLNRGATRVEIRLDTIAELDEHDDTSKPDYYPAFLYPGVAPIAWQFRVERNLQFPNVNPLSPRWPGWKAYPNDFGVARVGFQIYDADPVGNDDISEINSTPGEDTTLKYTSVPITGCVTNAAECLNLGTLRVTLGFGGNSSVVNYRVGSCVWSWLPGDTVDPDSLCPEAPPQISVHDVRRAEGNDGTTNFDFLISMSAPSLSPVTVRYQTAEASATGGSDFIAVPEQILTFAPGETRKTVTVAVKGDTLNEPDESFSLVVSAPTKAEIWDGTGVGTITTEDVSGVSIGDVDRAEGSGGPTAFGFTVTLDAPSALPVTVLARTVDGTAIAGSDYTAVSDTEVTFAPGDISKVVTVLVNGDSTVEAHETFQVTLQQATNAAILDAQGVGTIRNDDAPASLTTPPPQSGSKGASLALNLGTLVDGRPAGPWTITVNWGDSQSEVFSVGAPGALARSHVYTSTGTYSVEVSSRDKDGAPSNPTSFTVQVTPPPNQAPVCTAARPSVANIVANPHAYVNVNIVGVTDPDGHSVRLAITGIRQDEAVLGVTTGDVGPDATGVGSAKAKLRYERADAGDGRVYHISFTATDGRGGSCAGTVKVGVRKAFAPAVDGGALHDSTTRN